MHKSCTTYVEEQALLIPQPWNDGGRVHNWRNYVGEHVRALWDQMSDQQKIAIALDADCFASREEWE